MEKVARIAISGNFNNFFEKIVAKGFVLVENSPRNISTTLTLRLFEFLCVEGFLKRFLLR